MKTGICVLGLHKELANKVANNLAKKLDMFFVDIDALVDYEILNPDYIIQQCGVDYLNQLQRDCVKRASLFENSIKTIDFRLLSDIQNLKQIKDTSILVYIQLTKENYNIKNKYNKNKKLKCILDDFTFEDRNTICVSESDMIIDSNNKSYLQISNLIIEKLKNM